MPIKKIAVIFGGLGLFLIMLMQGCVSEIEKLNKTNQCENCDLRGLDLSKRNLRGANLNGANLRGASMREVDLREAILTKADLTGANLRGASMRGVDLREAILTNANLNGADLSKADLRMVSFINLDLRGADLNKADLSRADLSAADLTGGNLILSDLAGADLSGANLAEVDLSGANLTAANLAKANLTSAIAIQADLTNANLNEANLDGAFLYGAILVEADLSYANLTRVKFSGADLWLANLTGAKVDAELFPGKQLSRFIAKIPIEVSWYYSGITSFEFSDEKIYFTSKLGKLFVREGDVSTVLLDLAANTEFTSEGAETGLLSVVNKEDMFYLSYTLKGDDDRSIYLLVDEYTESLEKIRNIITIRFPTNSHHGGTLAFDRAGKLYVSVGDGGVSPEDPHNEAQSLNSFRGKILRIDVTQVDPAPEIIAYGLRNPWKFSIDSRNRMFIGDVGMSSKESVYLIENLYPDKPYNLGWPVFEGTTRMLEGKIKFSDTLPPIYEYKYHRTLGRSVIGGIFIDRLDAYLFGDYIGNIRLIKKGKDGIWYETHFQETENNILSFGFDVKAQRVFMSGWEKIYQLNIAEERIK